MKKITISFKITKAQFHHFEKRMEIEGCESVTAMFRKAGFLRWPMPKSHEGIKQSLSDNSAITKQSLSNHLVQEEKKEEREKSPHTPLKEKEARKEEGRLAGNARTRTREEQISLADAVAQSHNVPALSVDLRKPPTLAEAIAYARLRMSDISVEAICEWHKTMTEQSWILRNGHNVRNWATVLRHWWDRRHEHYRREAALERDVAALEKRVELTEKANAAREAKQNAAASANSNSRYYNGRLKLSNHVDISEEERNDLLKDFFA